MNEFTSIESAKYIKFVPLLSCSDCLPFVLCPLVRLLPCCGSWAVPSTLWLSFFVAGLLVLVGTFAKRLDSHQRTMDSVVKAIVAAPASEPVGQVEFGCGMLVVYLIYISLTFFRTSGAIHDGE